MNRVVFVVVALVLVPHGAAAQGRIPEIGFDATMVATKAQGEPGVRMLDMPRWLRVGVVPRDEGLLLEGAVSWSRVSSGGDAAGVIELRPSVSWLWGREGDTRPYLGVVGDLSRFGAGADSRSQTSLGVAGGVRVPLSSSAVLRLEVGWEHAFESGALLGTHRLWLGAGVSVGLP
jgi:hypothetical protein